jgi:hypothetical protein
MISTTAVADPQGDGGDRDRLGLALEFHVKHGVLGELGEGAGQRGRVRQDGARSAFAQRRAARLGGVAQRGVRAPERRADGAGEDPAGGRRGADQVGTLRDTVGSIPELVLVAAVEEDLRAGRRDTARAAEQGAGVLGWAQPTGRHQRRRVVADQHLTGVSGTFQLEDLA